MAGGSLEAVDSFDLEATPQLDVIPPSSVRAKGERDPDEFDVLPSLAEAPAETDADDDDDDGGDGDGGDGGGNISAAPGAGAEEATPVPAPQPQPWAAPVAPLGPDGLDDGSLAPGGVGGGGSLEIGALVGVQMSVDSLGPASPTGPVGGSFPFSPSFGPDGGSMEIGAAVQVRLWPAWMDE